MKTNKLYLLAIAWGVAVSLARGGTEDVILGDYRFQIVPAESLNFKGGFFSSEIPERLKHREISTEYKEEWVLSQDHLLVTSLKVVAGARFLLDVGVWVVESGKITFYLGSPLNTDRPKKRFAAVRIWQGARTGSLILVEDNVLSNAKSISDVWSKSVALTGKATPARRTEIIRDALHDLTLEDESTKARALKK